jgi:hypothetical protein
MQVTLIHIEVGTTSEAVVNATIIAGGLVTVGVGEIQRNSCNMVHLGGHVNCLATQLCTLQENIFRHGAIPNAPPAPQGPLWWMKVMLIHIEVGTTSEVVVHATIIAGGLATVELGAIQLNNCNMVHLGGHANSLATPLCTPREGISRHGAI